MSGYTDPLLPFDGIHGHAGDRARVRTFHRRMHLNKCEHPDCHRKAKHSFRLENAELIDVCMRHFFYLANGLRDEDA